MTTLEFWPDYGGALLWNERGEPVVLDELPPDLVARATRWVAEYDDAKLPWEPTGDEAWLAAGRHLFVELRRELSPGAWNSSQTNPPGPSPTRPAPRGRHGPLASVP